MNCISRFFFLFFFQIASVFLIVEVNQCCMLTGGHISDKFAQSAFISSSFIIFFVFFLIHEKR